MQNSIVNHQSVVAASDSRRFDAEFFRPDYLRVQKQLEEISSHRLIDFGVKIKHPKEIKRRYVDAGILFLRAQNVRPLSIDLTSNPVYISSEDAKHLRDNVVHYKDILVTRTGANFGQCAIYLENRMAIASSHTFIIKSGNLNPFLTAMFLNTRYGRKLIDKGMYGGLQPEIAPYFLYQIPMPMWEQIQIEIEKTYLRSYHFTQLSKERYAQAQNILLSELGLTDWRPKHRLVFVKNYSDAEKGERIDAEYFQPKYEEIEEVIKKYENGHAFIRDEYSQNRSIFTIDDEKLYRYVEIGDVNVSNGEITANGVLGEDLPANAKRVLEKGDVIISKVRTYRGAIAIIEENGYIGSGAFCVLRENGRINKETLLAFLHSKPLLAWSLKPNTGTSYPVIVDNDILNLPIPILPKEIQTQIKQKIAESFNLRKQSKHLLECAKRAVEIAIEQNEQAAISWLKNATEDFHH